MRIPWPILCGITLVASAAGRPTRAQQYPPLPDSAHRSVAAPYVLQGPLPIAQEDDPRIAPGEPLTVMPGVPNGPPAITARPPGALARKPKRLPAVPPPGSESAVVVEPGALAFAPATGFPVGVEMAAVRVLENGGTEGYLRLPVGERVPPHFEGADVDLTLVRGRATLLVDQRPLSMTTGTHAFLPANTAHAIACSDREPCLLFVRSQGPLAPHYTSPSDLPQLNP